MKVNLLTLFILLFALQAQSTGITGVIGNRIVITGKLPDTATGNTAAFHYVSYYNVEARKTWQTTEVTVHDKTVKWELPSLDPLLVRIPWGKANILYYFEPGDSVQITANGTTLSFSGTAKAKMELIQAIGNIPLTLKKPTNRHDVFTHSIEDFDEWNEYLNQRKKRLQLLLSQYKDRVSDNTLNYLQYYNLASIELSRVYKYYGLWDHFSKNKKDLAELLPIYDRTMNNEATAWLQHHSNALHINEYYYFAPWLRLSRQYNFDYDKMRSEYPKSSPAAARYMFYIKHLTTILRDSTLYSVLTYMLTERLIRHRLYVDGVTQILDSFYVKTPPQYEVFKAHVKSFETERRETLISRGKAEFFRPYTLDNGKMLDTNAIKGKVVLLNFLQENDPMSNKAVPAIHKFTSKFSNSPGVAVYNIVVENGSDSSGNKTFRSIEAYRVPASSEILRDFSVKKFPVSYLVDTDGAILGEQFVFSEDTDLPGYEATLTRLVAQLNDGPYVNVESGVYISRSVQGGKEHKVSYPSTKRPVLAVATDKHDQTMKVPLRDYNFDNTRCIFNDQAKILAISDIEGNFTAFRRLLQANGVIDKNYNWTFGNGHLVLAGDFFDRGQQVTECLWLIYMLEEKAREAGGNVHFILGNHEVMNLTGDSRYVREKYKNSTKVLQLPYERMYDTTSVLGKWLRSKNTIELINGILFVHGGISEKVLKMGKSLEQINTIVKKSIDIPVDDLKKNDTTAYALLYGYESPLWFRSYYDHHTPPDITPTQVIHKTLTQFGANKIVTGHTVHAGTINVHYGGKVINIDLQHKNGFSEALLVDGKNFYRTNSIGQKIQLTEAM